MFMAIEFDNFIKELPLNSCIQDSYANMRIYNITNIFILDKKIIKINTRIHIKTSERFTKMQCSPAHILAAVLILVQTYLKA
jgi:hypothetical protein